MHQAALDIPTPTVKLNKHGTSQTNVNGNHIKPEIIWTNLKNTKVGKVGVEYENQVGKVGVEYENQLWGKGFVIMNPKKILSNSKKRSQ